MKAETMVEPRAVNLVAWTAEKKGQNLVAPTVELSAVATAEQMAASMEQRSVGWKAA